EPCSHAATCTVKGPMGEVYARLMGVLRGVTLAELFDPKVKSSTPHALPMLSLSATSAGGCCAATPAAVETAPA
ncbi:MAG: hypothetical protein K2V38_05605, partial [Gemmataceae bacterium]|nr:hypothetical protein [Gemmataceae bacterium]